MSYQTQQTIVEPVIEGFQTMGDSFESLMDRCYLKSKNHEFMPYYVALNGNELYFYKHQTDTQYKYMHSLTSCYLKSDNDSLTEAVDSKTKR